MESSNLQPAKHSYHKPRLLSYGNIQSLTQAVSDRGAMDGATTGLSMTML